MLFNVANKIVQTNQFSYAAHFGVLDIETSFQNVIEYGNREDIIQFSEQRKEMYNQLAKISAQNSQFFPSA